jgi:hypothetical protein
MTTWTEMSAIEFDATLAPTSKARKFTATAPDTLFPRLLPEAKRTTTELPDELPGQAPLFGPE